jgi:hypothetical protein
MSTRVSVTVPPSTDHRPPVMQVRISQLAGRRQTLAQHFSLLVIVGVLGVVATTLFSALFLQVSVWLPSVLIIAFVALTVSAGCFWLNASKGETVLVHIVVALLVLPGTLGVANARFGLPFPTAVVAVCKALVRGPVKLLTSPIPARNEAANLAVPVVVLWLGFVIASLLARRRNPGWALLGPLFTLATALAFVPRNTPARMLVAALFAALSFVFVLVCFADQQFTIGATSIGSQVKRVVILAAILGIAVTIAPTVTRTERFSLRDTRAAPFDPTELPSPLAEFRKYRQPKMLDTKLFTYTGAGAERWRLAVLPSYDGRVWSAGSVDDPSSGRFDLLGAQLRDPSLYKGAEIRQTKITVEGLSEPWITSPGLPVDISVSASQRNDVRHNADTGSLVLNRDLPSKSVYSISWIDPPFPTPQQLADVGFGPSTSGLPASPLVPRLGARATQFTKDGVSAWQQVSALKAALQNGYWNDRTPPGHSLGDMVRMVSSNENMQGTDEHFASLFAVLARARNIPARVVVGFAPNIGVIQNGSNTASDDGVVQTVFVREPNTIYGRDIRAWAEVNLGQYGWVPVDILIDPSKKPKPKESRSVNEEDQKATPPNRVPTPESPEQQTVNAKKAEPAKQAPKQFHIPRTLIVGAISLLVPLVGVGLFVGLVGFVKKRRRTQRRNRVANAAAISGAWEELLERGWEVGIKFPRHATIDEVGDVLSTARPETNVRLIGDAVERAAFQAEPPTLEQRESTWLQVDETVSKWHGELSRWERFKLRSSVSSLRSVSVR